jgi:hypothetical protein
MSQDEFERILEAKVRTYAAPVIEGAVSAMHAALTQVLMELKEAGALSDERIVHLISRLEAQATELDRRAEGRSETAGQLSRMALLLRHLCGLDSGRPQN